MHDLGIRILIARQFLMKSPFHFVMSDSQLLCVLNNNKLILNLIERKLEENEILLSYLISKKKEIN